VPWHEHRFKPQFLKYDGRSSGKFTNLVQNPGRDGTTATVLVEVADAPHPAVSHRVSPRSCPTSVSCRSVSRLLPAVAFALRLGDVVPGHVLPPCLAEACRAYFQPLPSHCVLAMSSQVMSYLRVLLKLPRCFCRLSDLSGRPHGRRLLL
jgi:hypothetical protein